MSTLQQKEYLNEVHPRVRNISKGNKLAKTLQFSLISLLLIICLFLNCVDCVESKPDTKESSEIEAGTQVAHEIDSLYDELLQIEENIGKSIRKLQLLQKIQKTRVSLHSVQSLNKENALNSEINANEGTVDIEEDYNYENLFKEKLTHEELSVSNSFVEKNIFELQNSSFVKYAFLDTPAYVDLFRDYTEKVLIGLLNDGNLAIFSLNSGVVVNSYNLTSILSQDPSVPIPQSWEAEVQNFLTSSYESYMSVIFSDSSGNTYIIDLSIQPVKSNDNSEKEVKRSIRELGVSNFKYFNAWQELKQSNSTLYEEEILKAEEQISITKLTYFPNRDQGIFVFVDEQGYFNLFRRISSQNSESGSSHQVSFFKRVHSGFGNVEIVKQQMYLTLFTEQNKIGFIRAFDGEKGNAN
mmetsp:Transcript_22039/g.21783  ORF Transcript_22039/g.21783 Transcript_22039/m.21783 type:complete len:411 (-) Transcript_22039:747-1979(-)